ncbi:MAG: hypothetical protein B0W54_23325 [Cellvibrio sp. 79]|nr:MAG: hypothetical protein B0W54_23325 [Cellvibrio sp. 79]
MCLCNQLPNSFLINGKTYVTCNKSDENSYSYYLEGGDDSEDLHFTLATTGNGRKHVNDLEKIHVSIPVGGFNLHLWLGSQQLNHNLHQIPSHLRAAAIDKINSFSQEAQDLLNEISDALKCLCRS